MRNYINYDEFYDKLVNHLLVDETWRLKCDDRDAPEGDETSHAIVFTKHQYEAENGSMYDFIVYSYPFTLDAGFIQEDIDCGWHENIIDVWNDITETCNLKPFIEE